MRKGDRQRADLAHHLGFADPLDFARGIPRTVAPYGRELADGADLAIGVDLFQPEVGGVHDRLGHAFVRAGCHGCLKKERESL